MDPLTLIEAHAAELRALGAQRIGVFGSFARGEATVESDVDVYLEFAKGKKNYDNFFAIYELLQGLFGRPINLVTDGSLSERKARIILPYYQLGRLTSSWKFLYRPRWPRRIGNKDSLACLLLLLEVLVDGFQVVVELRSVSFTNLADFGNDRVFPHNVIPPRVLLACR